MTAYKIGPWPKGITNRFPETKVPGGALLAASNVDIDKTGGVTSRSGYGAEIDEITHLFEHEGRLYGLMNGFVGRVEGDTFSPLVDVNSARIGWSLITGMPAFTTIAGVWIVAGDEARMIGGANSSRPLTYQAPGLGLPPGRYNIGYTQHASGEGGMSATSTIDVAEGQGIVVYFPPAAPDTTRRSLYLTKPDGDVLFEIAKLPVSQTEYTIAGAVTYGKREDTLGLARMIGGSHVRYSSGRVLVARGTTLFYTDPFRWLYNPLKNYVRFTGRIVFIEPVSAGIYVGIEGRGVEFLAGESPDAWEQRSVSAEPPQAASILVPTAQMDSKFHTSSDVAVWMTGSGFAIGMQDGNVVYPQAELLSGLPLGTGNLVLQGDRLIALSQ